MIHRLVLVAAALASVAATCSRGEVPRLSQPEYEHQVKTLYAGIQSAFQGTRGVSGVELANKVALAQAALREAADALETTRPPLEVESDNRALAAAMREYADALDQARQAAATGDRAGLAPFENAAALKAVQDMAEAAERMKHKGYDLGPLTKD
ncbi:MAG TPA: hypothetical protein VGG03_09325 [Thermoanaerobaculia bacterium]